MKEMKKEKSCGAVIYKIDENKRISFLIVKQKTGNFGFPKGHVEEGETEKETAIREIKEETNIDALVDTNFRMVSTYSPAKGIIKDVVFFVAIALVFLLLCLIFVRKDVIVLATNACNISGIREFIHN